MDSSEDRSIVSGESIGFGEFTLPQAGLSSGELSIATGLCEGAVEYLLGKINTVPGPDEEVVVQLVVRKRSLRESG